MAIKNPRRRRTFKAPRVMGKVQKLKAIPRPGSRDGWVEYRYVGERMWWAIRVEDWARLPIWQ
jgi:hypothetical protein